MNKDLSNLFMDGLVATQSSAELLLYNAKVNFFSGLKRELRSLILSILIFLFISASAVYLILFGVSRALYYLKVDLLYDGPVYATTILILSLAYYAYSSYRQPIQRRNSQNENIKAIATFKHDMSELMKFEGEILKWLKKYKTFFVMVIAVSIFIKGVLFKPKANLGPMLKKDEKGVGLEENSIRDAIKGLIISVLVFMIKDLIEKIIVKPLSSPSPQSNKSV